MKVNLLPLLEQSRELQMKTRNWRNSESVSSFFKIKHIDEETHIQWLVSQSKINPRVVAYVICVEGMYVGVTYFHSIDYNRGVADWGIYIHDSKMRGRGIGQQVLLASMEIAYSQLNLRTIFLDVMLQNQAAVKLYERCGFQYLYDEDGEFARYSCNLDQFINSKEEK